MAKGLNVLLYFNLVFDLTY